MISFRYVTLIGQSCDQAKNLEIKNEKFRNEKMKTLGMKNLGMEVGGGGS